MLDMYTPIPLPRNLNKASKPPKPPLPRPNSSARISSIDDKPQEEREIKAVEDHQQLEHINSEIAEMELDKNLKVDKTEDTIKKLEVVEENEVNRNEAKSTQELDLEEHSNENLDSFELDYNSKLKIDDECKSVTSEESRKPPSIVGVIPKSKSELQINETFDTFTRKRGFQIGSSLLTYDDLDRVSFNSSVASERLNSEKYDSLSLYSNATDDFDDLDEALFKKSNVKETTQCSGGFENTTVVDFGGNMAFGDTHTGMFTFF